MVQITAKRIVLAAIGLVIAVLSILALCFTIIKMDLGSLNINVGNGSSVGIGGISDLTKENGFVLLGGQSMYVSELNIMSRDVALAGATAGEKVPYVVYDWLNVLMQVVNIVLLVAAVALVVLSVLWFCLWKKDSGINAVAITGICIGALYMAAGLTFFFVVKNAYIDLSQQGQESVVPSGIFKTSCFVPLILLTVAEVAYWICKNVIKERDPAERRQETAAAAMAAGMPQAAAAGVQAAPQSMAYSAPAPQKISVFDLNEKSYAENLTRLKELCDAGVLTPEEYEEQKALNMYGSAASALARQWQMYQSGLITAEEYEELKKKILKLE